MSSEFTISPDAIYVFAQKAWWFLIVLGVLVAFHEFGHFLAARWVGVKVLKFSLGFGPKLLSQTVRGHRVSRICHSVGWICQVIWGRCLRTYFGERTAKIIFSSIYP